jgi:hypothetical protein
MLYMYALGLLAPGKQGPIIRVYTCHILTAVGEFVGLGVGAVVGLCICSKHISADMPTQWMFMY